MILSKHYDLLFLKFPIYLPIIYCSILYMFPNFEFALVFFTLLLLAEPHFGATWPFFLNKINKSKIFSEKIYFIYLPIIIVIVSTFSYFLLNFYFLVIFFAINIFHVTRQSFGISKLFVKKNNELEYQKIAIYFSGFLFFSIGILRFYFGIINNENLLTLNILIILISCIFFIFYIMKFNFSENFFLVFSGMVIFYPICFVESPIHGIVMGVTIHYIQYLALTYKVSIKRRQVSYNMSGGINYNYLFIVLIYGLIMACLSFSNKFALDNQFFKSLLIIPLLGQMLHFYLDSLLWKFSDKHNRDVTLKYLKI